MCIVYFLIFFVTFHQNQGVVALHVIIILHQTLIDVMRKRQNIEIYVIEYIVPESI